MALDASTLYFFPLKNGILWPYTARESARARKTKLSIASNGKTELILPKQRQEHTPKKIQEIVDSMLPWFCKTIDKLFPPEMQAQAAMRLAKAHNPSIEDSIPQSIALPLLGEVWHVYVQKACKNTNKYCPAKLEQMHSTEGGQLILTCQENEALAACTLLMHWLKDRAKPSLELKTRELAAKLGLHVNRVSIGAQRTRWGSCSAKGNINLNCRILLLPSHLAEHIILHELCHLVHLNHSKEYRALLASVNPHWKEQEKALNVTWKHLPFWTTV